MKKYVLATLTLIVASVVAFAGNSSIDKTGQLTEQKVNEVINLLDTVMSTATKINGETIANDTIDDDSIDFTDVTGADLTLTDAGAITASGTLTASAAFYPGVVLVTDTNAYTVLAANAGKVHIVPDLTAHCTLTMPAEAAGMYYKFVYAGGAADAQNWIITTGADANYFVGGLVQFDEVGSQTNSITYYFSNGSSNSKLTVLTPNVGTGVEMWCVDGTTWRVSGTVQSTTDTGVTFANQ